MALIHSFILLAGIAFGQSSNFSVGCFNGLNDTDSPATIADCESQSALNVEPNKVGSAIMKRKGYAVEGNLSVTTSPVTGSHVFLADNGDNITVVCNDRQCSKSTNGSAFSIFLGTASAGVTRWSMIDVDGDVYGANDKSDMVFKYDGATLLYSTSIPQGSILELTQDRLAVSDTSANPNRVCYSGSGVFTDFTTGIEEWSSWCDDLGSSGDRVTGLKYDAGILYIFKTHSINACELGNQYSTKCSVLASYVGTKDPASVISTPRGVMFKGDDGHFWVINGGMLSNISKKISTIVSQQAAGSQRNNTTNGKTEWDAGAANPAGSWDTSSLPGSIFPSSASFVDTSSSDFSAGTLTNIDANAVSGEIRLSSTVYQDDFSDHDFTAGLTTWTYRDSYPWFVFNGGIYDQMIAPSNNADSQLQFKIYSTGFKISSGTVRFTHLFNPGDTYACAAGYAGGGCFEMRLRKISDSIYYGIRLSDYGDAGPEMERKVSIYYGSSTLVTSSIITGYERYTDNIWDITVSSHSVTVNLDEVLISSSEVTAIAGEGYIELVATSRSSPPERYNAFGDIYYYQYKSTGNIVSRIFDTGYTEPMSGPMSSTFTLSDNTGISFYVRGSSSPNNDLWTSWSAASDTVRTANNRRYWQYKALLNTGVSTNTPTISAVELTAATTGTYSSQCIQTGSGISAWGILSCAETKSGNGSLSYYVSTGTNCTDITSNFFSAHTNNATVAISTGAAFKFRFSSLLGAATDQAQVDACTIYWNEGTVAPPTWAVYDSANNNAYFSIATDNASSNNRLLRFDMDLASWIPWDLAATAPLYKDHYLYYGSAATGHWIKYGLTDSDNGSNINSYWKSKDWGGGSPFQEKAFDSASAIIRNQIVGSLDVSYVDSQGNSGSYTVNAGTDSSKAYIRNNYSLPLLSPSTFLNIQFGNNSSRFWELDGYRLDYSVLPWRPIDQ